MAVKPIPDGAQTVTPYLVLDGAARAIDYYTQSFGAKEQFRMPGPGGKVMHAELKIGNSTVMLADEMPEMGYRGPQASAGVPVSLMLYVEDVDGVFARAVKAGAKVVKQVEDQFYGDRTGTLTDPFGHCWTIATHKEDVAPEEMTRRFNEMMKQRSR
jgi:PhnB protein